MNTKSVDRTFKHKLAIFVHLLFIAMTFIFDSPAFRIAYAMSNPQ